MVPLVRLELTYYTPLFERGDFTKICPQGHEHTVSNVCIEAHSQNMLRYTRIFHTLQEVLLIPEDALICNFKVLPARVAIALKEKPWSF